MTILLTGDHSHQKNCIILQPAWEGFTSFVFVTVEVSGAIHSTRPKDLVFGIISAQ